MSETRVKIQSIVENQIPDFLAEESPLLVEFLKQYYISQEYQGASVDLIQNIDTYLKLEKNVLIKEFTYLSADLASTDTRINAGALGVGGLISTFTKGFPDKYGLLLIDNEIITYEYKTDFTFENCKRGFSGITSYKKPNVSDELTFKSSVAESHKKEAKIYNLSSLFLQEFFAKIKKQFIPGFSERSLDSDLNKRSFILNATDFYDSKGTDESFKILFGALYGEQVKVIKPRDFLFRPSDAGYRRTKDLVVKSIEGNPLDLLNKTLYQDKYTDYGIDNSYASVTDVEKIFLGGEEYFKLSFDYDYNKDLILEGSLYGNFSLHPKTRIVSQVSSGSNVIDVDSTVGFPTSGTLVTKYSSGSEATLTYSGKSVTQFYNVKNAISTILPETEINLDVYAYGYAGITTGEKIKVRIGSVLNEVVIPKDTYLFAKNDTARIKTLGISSSTIRRSNWIDNVSNEYKVSSFILQDSSNFTYDVTVFDSHNFRIGDRLKITDSTSVSKDSSVVDVLDNKRFSIRGQGQLNPNLFYNVSRYISKPNSSSYPELNFNTANIQNVYTNYSDEVLVASSSIPFYNNQLLNPYNKKVTFSGSFSGEILQITPGFDHGFYTGDKVYYSPEKISTERVDADGNVITSTRIGSKFSELIEGLYYVKRIDATRISLAKSPSNLADNNLISVSGIVTSNSISYYDFANKNLQAQNILREVKQPVNKSGNYITNPGRTGILINGVEILNYKSSETVFYGQIGNIDVSAQGSGYDVINPPSLEISDSQGIGATGICAVNGSLQRIEIINPGFDYVNKPFVTITGGNGKNASAEINMVSVEHNSFFNADSTSTNVNVFTDTIGFSTYHKFRDYERVIYLTDGQKGIAGLTTASSYYVSVIDGFSIKLHEKQNEAISGINTVNLNDYGTGIHRFKAAVRKEVISEIIVTNSGSDYQNKQRTATPVGINTALDTINIESHGYLTGEEITYSTTGTSIVGLNTTTNYLIKKIDKNSFKLAPVGLGTTTKSYYLDSEQYLDLQSIGSGVHSFNYAPISVTITGNIGVSTLSGQDFSAKIQPIFRGSIDSIHLTSNGLNYGSQEVINYNRQPIFSFRSGTGAELLTIVNNEGKITEVLVTRNGSGYNTPPNLIINGKGKYAKLTPIIKNGELVEVKVINGGIGYDEGTTVDVISAGENCRLFANIQQWTVNLFQKYFNILTGDDGIVTLSDRNQYGLQYCHLYAPRKLRQSVYAKSQDGDTSVVKDVTLYGIADLREANNEEISSTYHSPIIGWAYDGNPIYGPYGFSTPTGGTAKVMRSGYELVTKSNRPSFSYFPQGFFNEDYEFKGSGDLDEHNGRFCVTPDYPNGVYAYFSTISSGSVDTDGPFKGYKRPTFPYFIGTSFYSQPNDFNFSKQSNQDEYKFGDFKWFRNTVNYKLKSSNSFYKYIFNPDRVKNQTVNVNYASKGKVETIGILTGGTNYNVGDRLIFDNSETGGLNASAKIEKVFGKNITNVSASTTSFSSVEFATLDGTGQVIGFTTTPHRLKNLELVNVSGLNTYFSKLQGSYTLGIRTDNFITTLGIGTIGVTGLTTYFYLSGILEFPYIRENDILGIGTQEKVKVLNVDTPSGRIRVLREYNSTVSSAYTATTPLYEDPRKFRINTGFKTDYAYSVNREIYFDPKESVGIGTIASVGIGTTITFSLPGVGATQVFVPYQSIYLPNHQLKTGEKVSYSTYGETSISIFDGVSSFALSQIQDLYVANISNNFIGVSTVKIGLGSTGFVGVGTTSSVGLLFFKNFGTGSYHSFKTKREVISGEISKNIVTVSTASTHGLNIGDKIELTSIPKNEETIVVQYNDTNRRVVFKPQSFTAGNVDTVEDTIYIQNHELKTGDKVIYTSSSPSGGLSNQKIYYILYYTKDKVRLCATEYDLNLNIPNYINITSASGGTLSLINPQLNVYRNKIIKFNLSDPSLSYLNGPTLYSAFELNFYRDSECKYKLEGTGFSNKFEVVGSGRVGIDTTANVSIILNDEVPNNFFYKLESVNKDFIGNIKKELIVDSDVYNHNQINLISSKYSGTHRVTGIGTTNTFTFDLLQYPEQSLYNQTTSNIFYKTNSLTAYGAISDVTVTNGGSNYEFTPEVSSTLTTYGSGAIFEANSKSIGNIVKNQIEDIGFDYPTDLTLSPSLNLPEILQIEPLTSFKTIGISSAGKNYLTPPGLVVIDGYTKQIVANVDLRYEIGATSVKIAKNTYGMFNTTPTIIPINNSNGVGINIITYNATTKNVTVGFNTGFSDAFPFSVGDKVLIENTSVGVGSTARGFNSSEYGYELFTLTAVNPALGGNTGSVTYNLTNYLKTNEFPGVFDPLTSKGRIINRNEFPVFSIELKKNNYFIEEEVSSQSGIGIVESWNNKIEYLKVSTDSDFQLGEILTGKSSNTRGVIKKKIEFDSFIKLGSSSQVNKGWIYDTGVLNNNVQRIADNNYYQYFSYSLKSRIPIETWNDSVQTLNHTSGFLKFSDLMIENQDEDKNSAKIFADSSITDVVVDIIGSGDVNCVYVFDLATEKTSRIGTGLVSNEIILQNRILTDYFESIGNRVLIIDDISNQFNNTARPTRFSVINEFTLTSARTKKYFTYVRDKRFTSERQILLVSLLHDNVNGYLNQYGRVETYLDLGSFDFSVSGSLGQLTFYPIKYSVNDYDISCVSHDLKSNLVGVGQSNLGNVVNIKSGQTSISSGSSSATNIVSIADTYRSAKILVEIGTTNESYYEFDELNIIQDGTNVELIEYGQLTSNNLQPESSPGLGTYIPYFDGSNFKVDFKPNSALGIGVTINTFTISIASSTSASTGIGTDELNTGYISSGIASITASASPLETVITEYPNNHSCAYYIVSVEDTTNQRYQISEVVVADDGTEASITEYGIVQTHSSLGTVGAAVSTNGTQITFTAEPNIDVQVRVFQNALSFNKESISKNSINFVNAEIISGYGNYEGTDRSIKRSFELTHKQNPIFLRYFNGSSSAIVNIGSDTITIPDHYYVTGEKVRYSHAGAGTTQAIGIAQTVVTGIGTTDKLPSTVYIVKVNESTIKLARSATDALKANPIVFNITSVGIGTSHSLTATNQNAKNIIAIDNYFQSPIVGTAITTTLVKDITTVDNRLTFSGITSFFGGNLIQINNEIMKINTVGLGSTNVILVDRPWMGTGLSTHSAGDLIKIIDGNYNIIENTIHFAEAPYGPTPIGSTTNPPNERDWTGITTYSTFQGRTFLRSGIPNTAQETYETNYIFDGISNQFTGIGKTFTLTSNNQNITGFSTNNAVVLINGIFQGPQGSQAEPEDYTLIESAGISSIRFVGTASSVGYDVNNANIPVGGIIVSVGSTNGFGLQPLVAAGGTAVVSAAGTISSISIGNSGSGYRIGIQTVVNVGVQTSSTGTPSITFIGTASVSNGRIIGVAITNPGIGYTRSNPPNVIFDSPLSYSNIPLIYSSSSIQGIGTQAKVDVVVGQGSSVIDFTITNTGYGYGQGQILTVQIGGNSGIPTDVSKPYSEFQITIDKTYNDFFSGWVLGELQVLDSFEDLFDGVSKKFPLKLDGGLVTIRAAKGSNIDVKATLLVFINDVLQKPGEAYYFEGGSVIEFSEAPKNGDFVKVLFYKGSGSIDVVFRDVLETIKVGDEVTLNYEPGFGQGPGLQQDERVVIGINTTDSLETNPYSGPGITTNDTLIRPLKWCKQTSDKIINGRIVGKDRIQYEPLINPSSYLINGVGIGSTTVYVDNVKPFFDAQNESPLLSFQKQITFTSQDSLVAAAATAVASAAGLVTSITITNGGYGYSSSPIVTIAAPVGLAVTYKATASSTISSGVVNSISVVSNGIGYSSSNPPTVLIEPPTLLNETVNITSYSGDSGVIVGVGTTTLEAIFDLFIPTDSFLRNSTLVGSAITISGISTGDFFVIYNSNVGQASTSINSFSSSNQIIGIGTQFLDNVYQVSSVQNIAVNIIGIGTTHVRRVHAKTGISTVDFSSTLITFDSTAYEFSSIGIGFGSGTFLGISTSNYFGNFSWGKIALSEPLENGTFNSYTLRGTGGITTSTLVNRTAPLKYLNYTS